MKSLALLLFSSLFLVACSTPAPRESQIPGKDIQEGVTGSENTDSVNSDKSKPAQVVGQEYTLAEVATHNKETDCWLVVNSNVYDVTAFISSHPGGKAILKGCGKDATDIFSAQPKHAQTEAQAQLPKMMIGKLVE